jgi:hypothetical protein
MIKKLLSFSFKDFKYFLNIFYSELPGDCDDWIADCGRGESAGVG